MNACYCCLSHDLEILQENDEYYVQCKYCGTKGIKMDSIASAVENWDSCDNRYDFFNIIREWKRSKGNI